MVTIAPTSEIRDVPDALPVNKSIAMTTDSEAIKQGSRRRSFAICFD